jgi:hypothetical protein
MPLAVPAPDTTHTPQYRNGAVVECLYSADNRHRAVLVRAADGLLHIHCDVWDTSEWRDRRIAFWNPVGKGASITDTIENARVLGRERLLEVGASADRGAV